MIVQSSSSTLPHTLRTNRFAVVDVTPQAWEDILEMHEAISTFFRTCPLPVKLCTQYGDGIGYIAHPRGIFEEYIVKLPSLNYGSPFPWPISPQTFEADVRKGFKALHTIGCEILAQLGVGNNAADCLNDLVGPYSDSVMFCRHYLTLQPEQWGGPRGGPGHMEAHTDTGLLTLMPALEVRGLQVLNEGGEWVHADAGIMEGHRAVIVMVGEALAGATNNALHAAVHRVDKSVTCPKITRLTTPFQLRGGLSALDAPIPAASEGRTTRCQMKVLAF